MEYKSSYISPIGPLLLTADGQALTGLVFGGNLSPEIPLPQDSLPLWEPVDRWLSVYFSGRDPGPFPVPLDPRGTDFQQRVWKLVLEIPYGETRSYLQLARSLSPTISPQAVGHAVSRNPIAIAIPCHRVIGSQGRLTGYAWGLDNKKFLLD